jgi:multicomponent Na+:H+ antiporter subunit C
MADLLQALGQRPNFVVFVILFLWGIYIMAAHPNYVKKVIGLYIVQTSVLFFLVAFSFKDNATVPIISDAIGTSAAAYVNPFPHVLTVTAIVVQVATLGVSLALILGIHRKYESIDEDEVVKKVE